MLETAQHTPPLELHSGDHMSREEFHAIYKQMPEELQSRTLSAAYTPGVFDS